MGEFTLTFARNPDRGLPSNLFLFLLGREAAPRGVMKNRFAAPLFRHENNTMEHYSESQWAQSITNS